MNAGGAGGLAKVSSSATDATSDLRAWVWGGWVGGVAGGGEDQRREACVQRATVPATTPSPLTKLGLGSQQMQRCSGHQCTHAVAHQHHALGGAAAARRLGVGLLKQLDALLDKARLACLGGRGGSGAQAGRAHALQAPVNHARGTHQQGGL